MEEHDRAVADARAHLEAKDGLPLDPLPAGFPESRASLHRVAEDVLKPKRELETGNEIALGFTPGGFGTPPWENGLESGAGGWIRLEGVEIVTREGGAEIRRAAGGIDPAGAAALADWFAFGTVVLAELVERHRDLEPAPIRLWPEHFDVATELGSEAAGRRANYGASPGDEDHAEPYLYVGPWDQSVAGELWTATAFVGAELGHRDLLVASDQVGTALGFMEARLLG
jgi:hypothetical protein